MIHLKNVAHYNSKICEKCPSLPILNDIHLDSISDNPKYKTDHKDTGNIDVFQKGNNIYIKKSKEDGLISLNPDYLPLTADDDRITVLGKALGKAEEI